MQGGTVLIYVSIHGYEKHLCCKSFIPLEKMLNNFRRYNKPFVDLEQIGEVITGNTFAEIEQSSDLAYSVYFYLDEDRIEIYTEKDGVVEIQNSDTSLRDSLSNHADSYQLDTITCFML